jgi:hypothetical protein
MADSESVEKKPRGGKRSTSGPNGGGRPKSSYRTKSIEAVRKVWHDGQLMPLDVMVQTMRDIWQDGEISMEEKIQACAIAEKCAPYLHPRLASTQVTADVNASIKGASTEELRAELKAIIAEIGSE